MQKAPAYLIQTFRWNFPHDMIHLRDAEAHEVTEVSRCREEAFSFCCYLKYKSKGSSPSCQRGFCGASSTAVSRLGLIAFEMLPFAFRELEIKRKKRINNHNTKANK